MNYQIGEMLRQADIGINGERVSFIHCGHASDIKPELIAYLETLEPTITVNLWGRMQLKRLAEVLYRPSILAAIHSGHNLGFVKRDRLIEELNN